MKTPGVESSVPSHWSKDYVEHLRTVHFTLIAIATGLVVVVLSAKPYNPATALRQVHEIIELKKMWSVNWIIRKGTKKEMSGSVDHGLSSKTDLASLGSEARWNRDPLMPDSSPQGDTSASAPDLDSLGNASVPTTRVFYGRVNQQGRPDAIVRFSLDRCWDQQHTNPDWSPEDFPTSLAGFRQWWTVLSKQHYVAVFPRAIFQHRGHVDTVASGATISLVEAPEPLKISLGNHAALLIDESEANPVSLDDKVSLSATAYGSSFSFTGLGNGMYFFPVSRFAYVDISQDSITSEFKTWKTGDFDSSFADLARAARDLEALELDDVEKFIAAEAAKGSEVFEALGMKFPADQVTLWGIVGLLSVQVYFYVYLKQLSGKLAQNDAGWDVPWIGMDTSALARSLLFLTIVLLPSFAVALLAWHATFVNDEILHRGGWALIREAGFLVAVVFSGTLGVMCWLRRPRSYDLNPAYSRP